MASVRGWIGPRRASLSIAAGIGAALCGLGLAVIILLEEENRINSLDADTWRPPLLVWTISLLAIAWLLRFKSQQVPSSEGVKRLGNLVVPMATMVVALSMVFPIFSSAISSVLEPTWPKTMSSNAVRMEIKIPTMDCATCARSIDLLLRKEPGLQKAEFDLKRQAVAIWYDPQKNSKTTVVEALKCKGFSAVTD